MDAPKNELDARIKMQDPLTLALIALAANRVTPSQWRVLDAHGWGDANARAARAELAEMARQPA